MEDSTNHLDYNAPLRSVRRFHSAISSSGGAAGGSRRRNRPGAAASAGAGHESAGDPLPEREPQPEVPATQRPTSLPFYKSDHKSGPYREPGVVPFVWEQAAGCPKPDAAAQCSSSACLPDEEQPTDARPQVAAPSLPPGSDVQPPQRDEKQSEDAPPSSSLSSQKPPAASKSNSREQPPRTSPEIPKPAEKSRPASTGKASRGSANSATTAAAAAASGGGGGDDNASETFSDALDTLSLADSCFMNCSVSGTTAFPDAAGQTNGASSGKGSDSGGGSFSTDPQVRDFMMGRFLPAAQAMAATSPPPGSAAAARRNTPERSRPVRNGERRQPVPLPYQHRPHAVLRYPAVHRHQVVDERSDDDSDDSDEDVQQYGKQLSLRGCGFLPRFCFSLMNPVPGARLKGRLPSPHRRIISSPAAGKAPSPRLTRPMPSDQGGERTWEAVYKHKLGRPDQRQPVENGSKLTSGESNQLTYWSDSQSPDGSSPFRRSTGCSPSPFAHEPNQSPFREEDQGSVGTPPKHNNRTRLGKDDSMGSGSRGSDKYLDFEPQSASWSGSGSPAVEKTLYVDSENVAETPISRFKSVESGRTDSKLLQDGDVVDGTQSDSPQPAPIDGSASADSCKGATVGNELVKVEDTGNNHLSIMQALLPPPLPKSPSESWLWRTLPNVSSKSAAPPSLLGVQLSQNKKKGAQTSSELKWETMVKSGSQQTGQARFGEVLAKPAIED